MTDEQKAINRLVCGNTVDWNYEVNDFDNFDGEGDQHGEDKQQAEGRKV